MGESEKLFMDVEIFRDAEVGTNNNRPLCSLISNLLSIALCLMSVRMPLHQESCEYPFCILLNKVGSFSMLNVAAIMTGSDGELGSCKSVSTMVLSLPLM